MKPARRSICALDETAGVVVVDDENGGLSSHQLLGSDRAAASVTALAIACAARSRVRCDFESTAVAADKRRWSSSDSRCDVTTTTGTRAVAGSLPQPLEARRSRSCRPAADRAG